MSLSDEIFELQEVLSHPIYFNSYLHFCSQDLLVSNESLQPPPRKRRRTQTVESEPLHDFTAQVREASQAASALQHTYVPFINLHPSDTEPQPLQQNPPASYPNTHKMVLQNPSGSAIRPPPVQPRRILQQINTWPEIDCAACR
jgi:hypothetical protein